MTPRLTSVTIRGVRSIENETIELAPLSVFCGPNGTGKSSVLGAVAYAITGRFPGVTGDDRPALLRLTPDPTAGMAVCLRYTFPTEPTERSIVRSVTASGFTLSCDVPNGVREKPADLIARDFGDLEFALNAFDPEKSLWRKSTRERLKWAFELAGAWTREKLEAFVGPKSDDWDPWAGADVHECVELQLARLTERRNAVRKLARRSEDVADTIAVVHVSDEAGAKLERDAEQAHADKIEAVRQLERARGEEAAAAMALRSRLRIMGSLERVRREYQELVPPEHPQLEPVAELDAEVLAAEIALDDSNDDLCPACGAPANAMVKLRVSKALEKLDRVCSENVRREGVYAEKAKSFERSCQALLTNEKLLLEQLDTFPADRPAAPEVLRNLIAACDAADTREKTARAAVSAHAQAKALQLEAQAHSSQAKAAAKRAGELDELIARLERAQAAMIADGTGALTKALDAAGELSPTGSWVFRAEEAALGYEKDGRFVSIHAMSAGERYRATVALLVAVLLVRQPSTLRLLLLDEFEKISDAERDTTLRALVKLLDAGVVHTALVAGAFDSPRSSAANMRVERRGVRIHSP